MPWTCIALGSNLGNRLENLQQAVKKLSSLGKILKVSSLYWSAPYGKTDQNAFYNAALLMHTNFTPEELMNSLLSVENEMGRIRSEKWGPRILDLDIIFYEDRVIEKANLKIPHPDFINRNFVLLPLAELVPDFVPPGCSLPVSELAENIGKVNKIRKLKRLWMT